MTALLDVDRPAGEMVRCCVCGKKLAEVTIMVTSDRGICICDECVDVCTVMVAEGRIARRAKEPTK